MNTLDRVRRTCLALPEATEKEAWGTPTFRVKGKMFAMYVDNHHGDGRLALWCKAPPGEQSVMVGADPDRFFVPPYVGPSGWVGVRLDRKLPWDDVTEILATAYRMAAPKRLIAQLEGGPSKPTSRERGARKRAQR